VDYNPEVTLWAIWIERKNLVFNSTKWHDAKLGKVVWDGPLRVREASMATYCEAYWETSRGQSETPLSIWQSVVSSPGYLHVCIEGALVLNPPPAYLFGNWFPWVAWVGSTLVWTFSPLCNGFVQLLHQNKIVEFSQTANGFKGKTDILDLRFTPRCCFRFSNIHLGGYVNNSHLISVCIFRDLLQ
jgi:hypothetical protein